MTNLKDKLSASVRQSKLATSAAVKPQGRGSASRPAASETTPKAAGLKATASQATASKATATQATSVTQAPGAGGFAFPDRVWPD